MRASGRGTGARASTLWFWVALSVRGDDAWPDDRGSTGLRDTCDRCALKLLSGRRRAFIKDQVS